MSTDTHNPFFQLLLLGSIVVPLACIPYIPIRRHLLALRRSLHALSNETTLVQHELSNTLIKAQLCNEQTVNLAQQLRDLRTQIDTAAKRAVELENARLTVERETAQRHRVLLDRAAEAESARLKAEEVLRREIDCIRRGADMARIPPDVWQDLGLSLGDTAAFLEEVEIQLGWPHSMPRDRGIDRMRQLALKLHTMARSKPANDP